MKAESHVIAFAQALKHLRVQKHWSQEQLAAQSEIHVTIISRLENSRITPSYKRLFQLAKAFDISVSDLFIMVERELK